MHRDMGTFRFIDHLSLIGDRRQFSQEKLESFYRLAADLRKRFGITATIPKIESNNNINYSNGNKHTINHS